MARSRPYVDDPELTAAIGAVAYESAVLDDVLRQVLHELVLVDDVSWILMEGQGTESLVQSTKTLLDHADHGMKKFGPEGHAGFKSLLDSIRKLTGLRNAVIHGSWSYHGTLEDQVKDRPWGGPLDNAYFCMRSRIRRYDDEQLFTVDDVERIAEEYRKLSEQLVDLTRKCVSERGTGRNGREAFMNWDCGWGNYSVPVELEASEEASQPQAM